MGKALPALMIVLGTLLLIATLYDVALRVNPALIPAPPPLNPPQTKVITETVTRTVVVNESAPLNASVPDWWYPPPSGAVMLDLSGVPADTPVKVVARMNYSEGLLRNVTLTVVGRVKPEAWNATVMVYVGVSFSPPLPNGTEVDVMPVWVANESWPASMSVSQHRLPMRGEVSEVNMTLCYYQQHLPNLALLAVKLTYLRNLGASDSFMILLKVGKPASAASTRYWRASIRLNGSLTLPPSALLPLKDGGVLVAGTANVGGVSCVAVIKLSPEGRVLNAVFVSVAKRYLSGGVELSSLSNGYLLVLGDLAAREVILIRLSSALSVVKAVALTLPPDTLSWSVATLGDRVYVTLTWLNAPYAALLVFSGDLTLVKAWAYSIGFPPNNLTPAETWCSIREVGGDLIMTCMPPPPPANLVLPKVLRTPVLIVRVGSDGNLKDFRFLLFDGIGAITPSIVKLGDKYLLMTFVNIINGTQTKASTLLITLGSDLTLKQAKLMNTTPLRPELLKLGQDRAVLVGTINSTPYLLTLDSNGNIINASPQEPGYVFSIATENNTIYLATQETQAHSTTLTVAKLPPSKINTTTVTLTTTPAQATQPTTGNHVTPEPLPLTAPIKIKDITNHITTHTTQPQTTVTPLKP